jgi:hypothetical protein
MDGPLIHFNLEAIVIHKSWFQQRNKKKVKAKEIRFHGDLRIMASLTRVVYSS